jgi:hypothetical protein
MKKSQLIEIIKEEVTKVLQEITQEKLQGSFNPKVFLDIGVASNVAQEATKAINKLKGAKGPLGDVNLDRPEKEALTKIFVALLSNDDASKLNAVFGNIKSFKTQKLDKPGR